MQKFAKSSSGKTIIVTENVFNALGLPISRKTGLIRPQEDADLDTIISHLEAGDVKYVFQDKPATNGIYEMDYAGEVESTVNSGGELQTA